MLDLFRIAKENDVALIIEYNSNYDHFEIRFKNDHIKGGVSMDGCYFRNYPTEFITERIRDELERTIRRSSMKVDGCNGESRT